jgi:hypothetical protein
MLFCLGVTFAFLLNEREWFELRFQNRVVANLAPQPTDRQAIASQTVMFIYDDLSNDTALRNLKRVHAKAEHDGFVARVLLDSFTFTIAGVYTLGTGDQPSLVQVKSDFLSEEAVANNIFENVQMTGRRTYHIGEALWLDNFKRGIDDSFTRRDLGLFVEYGSDTMMEKLRAAISDKRNGLITIHIAETGHMSHKYGVYGKPLRELHQHLETELLHLTDEFKNEKIAWLVLSDHGTTERGQHGGISKDEQTSFLWAFGEGIKNTSLASIPQVDVVNIVSVLTGAPLATQNCGSLPDIFTADYQDQINLAQRELLDQKQKLYTALNTQFGDSETVDTASFDALLAGVNRIKFDASASLLLLPRILLAIALILLWASSFNRPVSLWHTGIAIVCLAAILMVPKAYSWWLFAGSLLLGIPLYPTLNKQILRPAGIVAIAAIAVSFVFYWFPSQVYLKQSAGVRALYLYATLGISAMLYLAFALKTASRTNADTPDVGALLLWGLSAAFVIATPCRYYQYVIPLGYIVLLAAAYHHQSADAGTMVKRLVKALPLLGIIAFAGLCQIPELGLNFFRQLPIYLRTNTFSHSILFFVALAGFGYWMNRHYRGIAGRPIRYGALAAVYSLHLFYRLSAMDSNLTLAALFAATVAFLIVALKKEKPGHGDYWLLMLLLAVMTQQQTGGEFTVLFVSALVFRWLYARNAYIEGSLRRHVYVAFLIIVFFVHTITLQGQLFTPGNFMVLKAFVGYRMPMVLPVSVALLVFYYLQPLLLAWLTVRLTLLPSTPDSRPNLYLPATLAAALLLLQVVFSNLLFSYSLCPGDTYIKTSTGSLIIMSYALGLIIVTGISRVVHLLKTEKG